MALAFYLCALSAPSCLGDEAQVARLLEIYFQQNATDRSRFRMLNENLSCTVPELFFSLPVLS